MGLHSHLIRTYTHLVKMSKLILVVLCLVIIQVQGGKIRGEEGFLTRVKRASCDPEGAQTCALEATQTYIDALVNENGEMKEVPAGEKPDYHERKTCNYLLETEKCFDKLENCGLPAAKLNEIKDNAYKQARDAAKSLPNWDDEKCQSSGASLATSIIMVVLLSAFASKI